MSTVLLTLNLPVSVKGGGRGLQTHRKHKLRDISAKTKKKDFLTRPIPNPYVRVAEEALFAGVEICGGGARSSAL